MNIVLQLRCKGNSDLVPASIGEVASAVGIATVGLW